MSYNEHSNLRGQHALMSPSKYYWLDYDEKDIPNFYYSSKAAEMGTILHDFAARCIRLGQKLPRSDKTLNRYVNDAIGYRMLPEQVLYYSDNCFGTTDAIIFKDDLLRVHDLKTGVTPASMKQLAIYAALFCLQERIDPNKIGFELRIYQNDEVVCDTPDGSLIAPVMQKIITIDKIITNLRMTEG